MNNKNWLWKVINTIGLLLTLGISMHAQAGLFGFGSTSWKEEVRLSDGRVIVVERELIGEAGGDEWASNRSGSKPKEYRIRFANPDGSEKIIEWRSTKSDIQTWPEIPLVFDFESGSPIVFSLVAVSACCEIYSKYVYKNGNWSEEALPEKFEQRITNLLFGSQKNMPKFVSLEEKRKRNNKIGYRKSLTQVGPSHMVKFP